MFDNFGKDFDQLFYEIETFLGPEKLERARDIFKEYSEEGNMLDAGYFRDGDELYKWLIGELDVGECRIY